MKGGSRGKEHIQAWPIAATQSIVYVDPMPSVGLLVVGAGISGLATVAFGKEDDYLVLDQDSAIGGYCKTVKKAGSKTVKKAAQKPGKRAAQR